MLVVYDIEQLVSTIYDHARYLDDQKSEVLDLVIDDLCEMATVITDENSDGEEVPVEGLYVLDGGKTQSEAYDDYAEEDGCMLLNFMYYEIQENNASKDVNDTLYAQDLETFMQRFNEITGGGE